MAGESEQNWTDIQHGQLSKAQSNRTNYTPGTTNGNNLDVNWGQDFPIPTGNPVIDRNHGRRYKRVYDYEERLVNDTRFPTPNVIGSKTYAITADDGKIDYYTIEDTTDQDNSGAREKSVGGTNYVSSSSSSSSSFSSSSSSFSSSSSSSSLDAMEYPRYYGSGGFMDAPIFYDGIYIPTDIHNGNPYWYMPSNGIYFYWDTTSERWVMSNTLDSAIFDGGTNEYPQTGAWSDISAPPLATFSTSYLYPLYFGSGGVLGGTELNGIYVVYEDNIYNGKVYWTSYEIDGPKAYIYWDGSKWTASTDLPHDRGLNGETGYYPKEGIWGGSPTWNFSATIGDWTTESRHPPLPPPP